MIGEANEARDLVSRNLANRLIATLDDRPFVPTAEQLAWIDGGDLVAGQETGPLARVVAGRYAALLADHVLGDPSVDGAPGAYIRILACARGAFLTSLSAVAADPAASSWENEGGASAAPDRTAQASGRRRGEGRRGEGRRGELAAV